MSTEGGRVGVKEKAKSCQHSLWTAPYFGGVQKRWKCGYVIYEWPLRDMKAGEEVFCSYDYKLDDAPPWYQDLWSNRICKLYKQQKVFWYFVIHILENKRDLFYTEN